MAQGDGERLHEGRNSRVASVGHRSHSAEGRVVCSDSWVVGSKLVCGYESGDWQFVLFQLKREE